jgi:hypothetical protein
MSPGIKDTLNHIGFRVPARRAEKFCLAASLAPLGPEFVGAACFRPEFVSPACFGPEFVGAACFGPEYVGAACFRPEFVRAARLGTEHTSARLGVIRVRIACHFDLLPGNSHLPQSLTVAARPPHQSLARFRALAAEPALARDVANGSADAAQLQH